MQSQHEREILLRLLRATLGAGVISLMDEPLVTDLVINPDETVFVKRQGGSWEDAGFKRPAASTRAAVMTTGTLAQIVVDKNNPYLGTDVPGFGWRMHAVLSPVVENATITLRKPPPRVYSLEDYRRENRISEGQFRALTDAVKDGKNIVLAGVTGSGKTTVLNALVHLIAETCPTDRVLILEDTKEIQCVVANATRMLVRPPRTMSEAVRNTLRMIPTRIIIGELRGGPETAALLRAWNTGHSGGLTSVHAGSARRALAQLEDYVADVPGALLRRTQIASVVQFVVYVSESRIVEVLRIHEELDSAGHYQWEEIAK